MYLAIQSKIKRNMRALYACSLMAVLPHK